MIRLHLGCGRTILEGYVNVDRVAVPGRVIACDLDRDPLPFDADSVGEVLGVHFLEHIANPLRLMQDLHRVCVDGALAAFVVPYGSSDDADEDPTHVRRYYVGSWGYFGQPYYWRADYGYRGDWAIEAVTLDMAPNMDRGQERHYRNAVREMTAVLRCVKPIREPRRELQERVKVSYV